MICFKCNKKGPLQSSYPWRGRRICAECAGRTRREDRPLGRLENPSVIKHDGRRSKDESVLSVRFGLADALWQPHERTHVPQPRIPTLGGTGRPADVELIAKVRGDFELRHMKRQEIALLHDISYDRVCKIINYQQSPHIDPK